MSTQCEAPHSSRGFAKNFEKLLVGVQSAVSNRFSLCGCDLLALLVTRLLIFIVLARLAQNARLLNLLLESLQCLIQRLVWFHQNLRQPYTPSCAKNRQSCRPLQLLVTKRPMSIPSNAIMSTPGARFIQQSPVQLTISYQTVLYSGPITNVSLLSV